MRRLFQIKLLLGLSFLLLSCSLRHKEVVNISATDLLSDFANDMQTATTKYEGKIIQTEGEIVLIQRPKDGLIFNRCTISFSNNFNKSDLSGDMISCCFKQRYEELKAGDYVIIKGKFREYGKHGLGSTIVLENCELVYVMTGI